jgi:hypothetical protein
MSSKRIDWAGLSHLQRLEILRQMPVDRIVEEYSLANLSHSDFRQQLAREIELWQPANLKETRKKGKPPTKDVVLGAWRDLDRAEALLELIDNSIDNWLRRRETYPKKTAPELNIYISIDGTLSQLTYEDNAGGVPEDRLENLVVPGFSETTELSKSIGSYKTGGKKAVFRLATAADITTRYWSPAETSDEAISVQLDDKWMADPDAYEFPYSILKNKSVVDKGQTRYRLQLRHEPIGAPPWHTDVDQIERITFIIRQTYTLLLVRHPDIHIHFLDAKKPLEPLAELYDFSGTKTDSVDIRPQQVVFETELEFEGRPHRVDIEVVLGCRTSSGVRSRIGGLEATTLRSSSGIDLYGNNRLFVAFDQSTFASLLPTGASRNLIRGYVNIHGPNVFIPWDTHKRHLNLDRDILLILTKHKLIQELFDNWKSAYNAIASGEVKKLVATPLVPLVDNKTNDIAIPHRATVSLDVKKKRGRGMELGDDVFVPKVVSKRKLRDDSVGLRITFTASEARQVAAFYGIRGDLELSATQAELASAAKQDLLKRSRR